MMMEEDGGHYTCVYSQHILRCITTIIIIPALHTHASSLWPGRGEWCTMVEGGDHRVEQSYTVLLRFRLSYSQDYWSGSTSSHTGHMLTWQQSRSRSHIRLWTKILTVNIYIHKEALAESKLQDKKTLKLIVMSHTVPHSHKVRSDPVFFCILCRFLNYAN